MSIKNETVLCHIDLLPKFYLKGVWHEIFSIKFFIIGSFVQKKVRRFIQVFSRIEYTLQAI